MATQTNIGKKTALVEPVRSDDVWGGAQSSGDASLSRKPFHWLKTKPPGLLAKWGGVKLKR